MIAWPDGITGIVIDEIDSTNREAARRVAAGEAGPFWIAARAQTAGRGRSARSWESPPGGNLYASLAAPFDGPPAEAARAGFAAALAVADTIDRFAPGAEVRTKWPNDVLLNGGKAAGILLESVGGASPVLVVGIGLNLATHPPVRATRWRATSLAAETGRAPGFADALETLARAMASWLTRLASDGFPAVRDAWLARAALLGAQIDVRLSDRTLKGRFTDLDADGMLVLDMPSGRRRIAAGDVFLPGAR